MSPDRKICSLDRLLGLRREAAAKGRRVIHCHGCFDIVHPGHIQYLQFARGQGDVLIVSVSADPQVNKGANRPLIPDDLRASSVAALECVDYVYVNPDATAVELIEQLRPDVYVKGREYEHNQDPRFLAERDCVMRFGGRVVFSSGDIVYSSTSLIGTLQQPEVFQDEKVKRFRQQYNLTDFHLANLIDSFRGRRIVVVGDYILDRYHFCDATNIASEGPMMSLRHLRHEDYDGGAAIIALHLAGLGAQATLVTSLAHDDQSLEIEARLMARGMETQCLHHRRQVVTKHRYLVDQSKLFKIDQGGTAPLDSAQEQILMEHIFAAAEGADGIIFADFGYGVLTAPLLDRILPELRPRVAVITADISGMQSNLLRFRDVDLLCPTERELREEMHDFSSGLNAVVCGLFEATAARHAFITMGKQGLIVFDQYRKPDGQEAWERRLRSEYLPAMTSVATDPLGCGDALLATASLALAAGGTAHAAAFLGSLAAAIEVQHVGNHPITTEQLLGRLTNQQPSRVEPARLAS